MDATDECIDVCQSLLRGELSAVESYGQAMEKFEGQSDRAPLQAIRTQHHQSVEKLRQHLVSMGATPDTNSGAWGTFAKAVEGTAKMFGESPALAALKQGEEHGISEYEDALENEGVMQEIKKVIRGELLPALRDHIATLDTLKGR